LRLEDEHYANHLAGTLSFQEQRRARLAGRLAILGCAVPPDIALDRLFEAYLRHYKAAWRAYEDVLPVLAGRRADHRGTDEWPGRSATRKAASGRRLGTLHLRSGLLNVAFTQAPRLPPSLLSCERLGCPPAGVFYVGDKLHTDALAATRAGLTGIWINRLGEETQEEPPHVVTDLREVLRLVLTRDR